MKHLIIILAVLFSISLKGQQRFPTGFPTQANLGWNKWGYAMSDSGLIVANRDTNWLAKYSGTVVFKPSNKKFYWFDSTTLTWNKFADAIDTTSMSNRINLKLNISDTSSMLSPYLRKVDTTNKWVQDVYVRNDSLFKFKNGTETFIDTLGGGGGGSGTVTSVGLSLPSAFNVTPSSITTSGIFAVTGAGTTSQYIRGNGTLATTDSGMIPNFHLKVRSLFSGSSPITFSQVTGIIGINNANTTGTKGAASFTTSFSDNGSGVIDLADLVSAGSCSGCILNIDAKGRITSYSTGAGGATNNTNVGSGFRPVNEGTQEMRTYFTGFGNRLDSVSNTNGLTWSADTTRSTGLPTYFYIDSSLANYIDTVYANNGLSNLSDSIQLGQAVSAVGNPAALHNDREIPLNGFRIGLSGTGSFGVGTNAPSLSYRMTVVGTGSTAGINVSTATATGINVSSTNTGISSFSSTGTAVNASTSGGAGNYAVVGGGGIGGTGGRFHTTFEGGDASPVVLELERFPTGAGVTNGAGFTIMFKNAFTSGATGNESGRITNYFSNAVSGSQTSAFGFHLVNNAVSARKALLAGSGQWTWDGYPALSAQTDSTTYKPIAIDGSGNVVKMANWIGSGSSGSNNTNIGSAFRWLNQETQEIKTVSSSNTIIWDSTSTANTLTAKVDTSVVATRFDLQADTLVWYRKGVVMTPTLPADENNFQEPSVFKDDNPVILIGEDSVFKMWYTAGWGNPNICYAESVDGYTWTRYGSDPVVANHSRGCVLKDGSTYVLYATGGTGGSLDRYTSSDGVTFSLINSGIISAGAPGTWNAGGVFNSWVIKDGATYRMLIDGLSGNGYFDGYYTSPDGITWTPYAGNPVTYITGPYFKKIGSTFWLWGHAAPTKELVPTDGYRAYSTDMITWTYDPVPYNSTFHRMVPDEGVDSVNGQVADFCLVDVGDSTFMYYSASRNGLNADGKLQLKLAVTGRTFSELVTTRENAALFNSFETIGRKMYYDLGKVAVTKGLLVGSFDDNGLGDTLQVTGNARIIGNLNVSGVINGFKLSPGGGSVSTNLALGSINSLINNTTGNNNTVVGIGTGLAVTTGVQNSAFGSSSFAGNNTGNYNSAFGAGSLSANTSGQFNTALGQISQASSTTASNVTSIGRAAGYGTTTGDGGSFLGTNAGRAFTTGANNTALGFNAGYTDGTLATTNNITGSVAIGYNSQVTQSNSAVIGNPVNALRLGLNNPAPSAYLHVAGSDGIAGKGSIKINDLVIATTATAGNGATVTVSFATQPYPPFLVGSKIEVVGVTPTGYNGIYTVTGSTNTYVQYANSTTGSQTVAGTISNNLLMSTPEPGLIEMEKDTLWFTGRSGGRTRLNFEGGIATLNTLTAATQTFATGTSGTDFNISSSTSTHTFNLPSASTVNRGLITTGAQSFAGIKDFTDAVDITDISRKGKLILSGDISMSSSPGIGGLGLILSSFTYTDGSGAGSDANGQYFHKIDIPTLSATNARTYSGNTATLFLTGVPIADGSATVSHPYNIFAQDVSRIDVISFKPIESNTDISISGAPTENGSFLVLTGSGGNTWTLPSLVTHPGKVYLIKNASSGNLTVQRSGSDNIYDTSSVTSVVVAAGGSVKLVAGASFWYVLN